MENQKAKEEGGKMIDPEHLKKTADVGGKAKEPDQPKMTYEQLKAAIKEDAEFLELRARVSKAKAEIASYTWQEISANHKLMEYKLQQQAAQDEADGKKPVDGKPNETDEK
jgi:hypothetical protein